MVISSSYYRNCAINLQGLSIITRLPKHVHITVLNRDDNEPEFKTRLLEAFFPIQAITDANDDITNVPLERANQKLCQRCIILAVKLQVTLTISTQTTLITQDIINA